MVKTVRLVCLDLIIMYLITRLPIPLVIIPVVGAMVIFNINQIKEIKEDANKTKKHTKRNKKVTNKK